MQDNLAIKERLLREAERALQREGYFGVSIRQVALSAGVHPSTVGHMFGGRAALLKAAEERMRGQANG
jgi:AcrR family transcriptional regulator